MARLWFGIAVAVVVFTVYALVDCAMMQRSRVRGLPRGVWILVILLVPVVGGLLWFFIGRERRNKLPSSRGRAPDDDPDFLAQLRRDQEQQDRIRKMEQDLADLDPPTDTPQPPQGPDSPRNPRGPESDPPGRRDA